VERARRQRLGLCYYRSVAGHLITICPNRGAAACNINKEQVHSLCSLRIPVEIKFGPAIVHAFLDLGATGNFIDKSLVCKTKQVPSSILLADGTVVMDHIKSIVVKCLAALRP
jgi:hypothetical protein